MKQILNTSPWKLYILISYFVYLSNAYDYKTFFLEDPDLCSQADLKTGKIKLDRGKYQAAKVLNKRNQDDFICSFKVKAADKSDGVIVVIQELSLRKDPFTGQCLDYIQFKFEEGRQSKKFCGTFNAELKMDTLFATSNVGDTIVENALINQPGSSIEVNVFLAGRNPSIEELPKTINIAFTLFTFCRMSPRNFKPCLDAGNICINQLYFNDNVYNCPYLDCVDEGGCGKQGLTDNQLSLGSKVLISSVSSLLISFIVFIICIYLCRKYKKLCFSEHFARGHSAEESQTPRVIEMNDQPSQATGSPGSRVANEDKDLPPSYDSLFPDR